MPANPAPAGARMLHTMLRVHDLEKSLAFYTGALACDALARAGVKIARPAGPMKADLSIVIAFVEDPDGYKVELTSTASVGR